MSGDPEPNYADFTSGKKSQATSALVKQGLEIVKWEKREWSASIFGCGMLFFYLTTWGGYTYLALASVLLIIHIIVSVSFNLYKMYSGDKSDTARKPWQIDVEGAKKFTESAVLELNKISAWYYELMSGKNLVSVLQAVGFLTCTWTLGSWMEAYTMFFLAFVGAFTVPVVYERNQALIHKYLDEARKLLDKAIESMRHKVQKPQTKTT